MHTLLAMVNFQAKGPQKQHVGLFHQYLGDLDGYEARTAAMKFVKENGEDYKLSWTPRVISKVRMYFAVKKEQV